MFVCVQTRIGEGQVSGLDCPTSSCSQPLSLPLLEALLPPDLLERYAIDCETCIEVVRWHCVYT